VSRKETTSELEIVRKHHSALPKSIGKTYDHAAFKLLKIIGRHFK